MQASWVMEEKAMDTLAWWDPDQVLMNYAEASQAHENLELLWASPVPSWLHWVLFPGSSFSVMSREGARPSVLLWPSPSSQTENSPLTFYLFLFLERGEGREKQRERTIDWLSFAQPGPQPRHVSWWVFEPATSWFTVQCSVCWATPARAEIHF